MAETHIPSVKQYHPATFLERGVAIPFTTPLLYGTRARPAERDGVELVIPNPSGGRGVYIMSWASMATLCRPTLHDRVFNERIASLVSVTPATIRRVARGIAAEGLAGEEAMAAARVAAEADRTDRVITNYQLLMGLVDQVSKVPAPPFVTTGPNAPDAAKRAQLTVDWVSSHLKTPTTWTATALEDLADVMTSVGMNTSGPPARIPRLMIQLRQTRLAIHAWGSAQIEEDQVAYGQMVSTLADLTLALTDKSLKQAQAQTSDMINLLRRWSADPNDVIQLVARPEWLLDGWEQICLIWDHARDDAGRRAAMAEIIGLVPVMPKEANAWCGVTEEGNDLLRVRRLIPLNEDWRTGVVAFRLIERNEHFRAIAA